MKYQGGKFKMRKFLGKFLSSMRAEGQHYYEPFVGGAWVFMEMEPPKTGGDLNKYVIALYKYIQESEELEVPDSVSEDEYNDIIYNSEDYPDWVLGYSIGISFGAKFKGGYARSKKTNVDFVQQFNRSLVAHWNDSHRDGSVEFKHCRYNEMEYKPNSLIYCDPPYANTLKYKGAGEEFDSAAFWEWAEDMTSQGHTIVVSESSAPDNWACVYKKETARGIRSVESKSFPDCVFMLEY
jgi:DNA adenine methylase